MAYTEKLHTLDELFKAAKQYATTKEYMDMIEFGSKMRHLGIYNAALAKLQRPGATYLLSAYEWKRKFNRGIKSVATPIIILMPFYPVDFLFDVTDTYPLSNDDKRSNDEIVEKAKLFFEPRTVVTDEVIDKLWERLKYNLIFCGTAVKNHPDMGSGMAADISVAKENIVSSYEHNGHEHQMWAYYLIRLNGNLSTTAKLESTCHELGHLLCHHLDSPYNENKRLWYRRDLDTDTEEFEAESVAKLVFDHYGMSTNSAKYLAAYVAGHEKIPENISVDLIYEAAGTIIKMTERRLRMPETILHKCFESFRW